MSIFNEKRRNKYKKVLISFIVRDSTISKSDFFFHPFRDFSPNIWLLHCNFIDWLLPNVKKFYKTNKNVMRRISLNNKLKSQSTSSRVQENLKLRTFCVRRFDEGYPSRVYESNLQTSWDFKYRYSINWVAALRSLSFMHILVTRANAQNAE